ncbi:MAG TPA: amino acid ABC transporter permease [Burkholderiaceae bacterium]|nr:amino acid ABC transporter permease [Burkholderiaceae bacterium]
MSAAHGTFTAIAARPAPATTYGILSWVRRNLIGGPGSTLATLTIVAALLYYVPPFIEWAVVNAVTRPDVAACRALDGAGACWGVIAEKYRLILFGRFPFAEQWRPLAATLLLVGMLLASCTRALWSRWLVLAWVMVFAVFFILMRGGVFGLSTVETDRWGGLPLTLLLSTIGIAAAFPIAVLVALGRRSRLPALRTICIVYVELIRGVPLISVLFMASFLFPLFMPQGITFNVLLRVLVGITLFAAAYLAEVVRGGLQAIPQGQYEAAASLGLSYWQTQRKIVLPQALRLVVPSIMNSFISTFKDTSLVTIVSLYELTGSVTLALSGDSNWRPFFIEAYLFIAVIYWVFCFAMSRYSDWVERHLNIGTRRA